jgi:hypothetical protein
MSDGREGEGAREGRQAGAVQRTSSKRKNSRRKTGTHKPGCPPCGGLPVGIEFIDPLPLTPKNVNYQPPGWWLPLGSSAATHPRRPFCHLRLTDLPIWACRFRLHGKKQAFDFRRNNQYYIPGLTSVSSQPTAAAISIHLSARRSDESFHVVFGWLDRAIRAAAGARVAVVLRKKRLKEFVRTGHPGRLNHSSCPPGWAGRFRLRHAALDGPIWLLTRVLTASIRTEGFQRGLCAVKSISRWLRSRPTTAAMLSAGLGKGRARYRSVGAGRVASPLATQTLEFAPIKGRHSLAQG